MSRIALLAIFLLSATFSRAEILLKGIATREGVTVFLLYSTEDQTSKWVSIGQSFSGVQAAGFDRLRDVLTVVQDQRRFELQMIKSAIATAPPRTEIPPGNVIRFSDAGASVEGKLFPMDQLGSLAAGLDKTAAVRIEVDANSRAGSFAEISALAARDVGITRLMIATVDRDTQALPLPVK
jgi:hypothetical protein